MKYEKIYAIDTNIILDDARNFINLSDGGKNLIILPETVLDEVDIKKSGFDEINWQAREYTRISADEEMKGIRSFNQVKIVETHLLGVDILTISKDEYKADKVNTSGNIKNDRKILEVIQDLMQSPEYKDLIFISQDGMARKRSMSLGIRTEAMTLGGREIDYNFIKTVGVDEFPKDGEDIFTIYTKHKINYFNYVFVKDGQEKFACIQNNRIKYLEEDVLRKQEINPIGKEQLFYTNALLDDHYKIVVAEAKAGTGKTLLALSAAMKLVRDKTTQYNKIVYIRNSIESLQKGEDVGYLSGNDSKFEIYNFPLYDTLETIAEGMLKRSKENKPGKGNAETRKNGEAFSEELINEKVEQLVERYNVQTMWTGALRGRTIKNAIIVMDEVQNMSNSTGQLTLTRVDDTCRAFVLGSNRQIDNQYINKHTSALSTILSVTNETHPELNMFAVELVKVRRGEITEWAERIFSKE